MVHDFSLVYFCIVKDEFAFAEAKDCASVDEVREFLQLSVEQDCEGLMVKTLTHNATYEPSKRSFNWLKVKKDYLEGMTDTFDLVPIGAYYGRGKRTGSLSVAIFTAICHLFHKVYMAAIFLLVGTTRKRSFNPFVFVERDFRMNSSNNSQSS